MLDTTLCIRVLRDRPQGLRPRFSAEAGALCISTVALAELLHGAGKSAKPAENRREVERFAARLDVLAFDAEAAAHAADIRTALERRGLVVVTGNLGEFSHVDGLRYEDWLAEGGGT